MKQVHPDAGGSTAEAAALNRAIADVRASPTEAPPTVRAPRAAPTPAPWPAPSTRGDPGPSTATTMVGFPSAWTVLAWVIVVGVAVALMAINWEAIMLGVATLAAIGIIASGFRD